MKGIKSLICLTLLFCLTRTKLLSYSLRKSIIVLNLKTQIYKCKIKYDSS